MEATNHWDRLNDVFRIVLDDETLALSPETTADDVDAWDSVKNVELMVAIEQEFTVRFATAEMTRLENVGQLMATLTSKLESVATG